MVNGTRLPQIRSRKCRNRSRCRRCTCDRSPSRAVAPVSAVCEVFRTQPSAYPLGAEKPNVVPPCGSVAGTASAGEDRLRTAFGGEQSRKRRSRTKLRGRARPAAVTSARGAGSLRLSRRGCCRRENSPIGVRKARSPAVSRKIAGLHTEIGGK